MSKTITITTTFNLDEDVTLQAIKDGEEVGILMIKDKELQYNDEVLGSMTNFKDDTDVFMDFVEKEGLVFTKVANRKYIKYNPNPKNNNTVDCTIRAYCKAENLDWNDAYDIASAVGKEMAMLCDDTRVVKEILTNNFKYEFVKLSKEERKKTVNEFAIEHPRGTYILSVRQHVVAVVDGYYYDSWDSGSRKISSYYHKQ